MNSDLNYEINYGTLGAPVTTPRPDPNAPLFASEDGLVASLSNSECIFQVKRTGATHVMTYQVLQALDQCREFRTLDEHVARILATIPSLQPQREGVGRVLESLEGRGLLVSDREFLSRITTAPARVQTPLRAVFIRACDRPAQLENLLLSLTEYERRWRRNHHYVLVDDSTSADAANRHRDLLREFARATGCQLTYLGAAEQSRFVERLARAVPAVAGVLPALLLRAGAEAAGRFGGGRGFNLALLLSAGARLVLLDDDHRLPLRRPDGAKAGLDPNPAAAPYALFHRNIEDALGSGEEIAEDPFDLHLQAAGQSLGELVSDPRYAVARDALRGLSLNRLDHLQGDASVLATLHGSYGSSRTESGIWLYQLAPDSREAFYRERASYLRNVEAGSLWYGFRQARVSTTATFTPFALDNSALLPCTNPLGRGEDVLFSAVTRLCRPDSLVLELPVAIGHVQESQRRRSQHSMAASTPRFNHFVSDFVQRQLPDYLAESPAQRMNLLAANLRDVAGAGDTARVRLLREYLGFARSDLIDRLQHQYDGAPDAPVYWQADVRSIIEANGRALIGKGAPRLGDWPETLDEAGAARALRDEMGQLAAIYEAWPALWSYARDEGERLLGAL
ncbi:MAG TPA: hypothetical protein VFG55_06890 [Rhodanobacteraceae bacterium]|nr:hypothetical protein [Rhodanobacteraceae bacterium]